MNEEQLQIDCYAEAELMYGRVVSDQQRINAAAMVAADRKLCSKKFRIEEGIASSKTASLRMLAIRRLQAKSPDTDEREIRALFSKRLQQLSIENPCRESRVRFDGKRDKSSEL